MLHRKNKENRRQVKGNRQKGRKRETARTKERWNIRSRSKG